jgi:dolichyl-phosphate beta-glucosyltransferase
VGNPQVRLSVVIPAYNEEARIGKTLEQVDAYLRQGEHSSEIILVSDGSADRTVEIARGLRLGHPLRILENEGNRGKGYSVRRGVMEAQGRHILFTDADLSTPIEEMDKFWRCFSEGYDVVIGSRALPGSEIIVHQPWYREFMGRVFNLLVRSLGLSEFPDTQCGFKAFTDRAAQAIFPRQTIDRWGFDAEILYIACRHRLRVAQVPIRWLNSRDSRINSLRDSAQMAAELIRVRRNGRRGVYG